MTELRDQDRAELSDVGFYWEGAYRVWHDGDTFIAVRKGHPAHVLTTETAQELRREICRDYGAWLASIRNEAMSL